MESSVLMTKGSPSIQVGFRITPEDFQSLQKHATQRGLTPSGLAKEVLVKALRGEAFQPGPAPPGAPLPPEYQEFLERQMAPLRGLQEKLEALEKASAPAAIQKLIDETASLKARLAALESRRKP